MNVLWQKCFDLTNSGFDSLANDSVQSFDPRCNSPHEIGHFILHHETVKAGEVMAFVDGSLRIRRDEKSKDGSLEIEREANAFAAELLMPRADIENLMSTIDFDWHDDSIMKKWSKHFDVSEQALTVRLMSLGYLEG